MKSITIVMAHLFEKGLSPDWLTSLKSAPTLSRQSGLDKRSLRTLKDNGIIRVTKRSSDAHLWGPGKNYDYVMNWLSHSERD